MSASSGSLAKTGRKVRLWVAIISAHRFADDGDGCTQISLVGPHRSALVLAAVHLFATVF
jgi:hypothetical protein